MSFVRQKEIPPRSGNWYSYLVENYATPAGPRQRVLQYLGKVGEERPVTASGRVAVKSVGAPSHANIKTIIKLGTINKRTPLEKAYAGDKPMTETELNTFFESQKPELEAAKAREQAKYQKRAEARNIQNLLDSKPVPYKVSYNKDDFKREEKQLVKWESSLPRSQRDAILDWTEHGFADVRSSQIQGVQTPESIERVKQIGLSLKTAPVYSKTIYRGIKNLSESDMRELANAKEIQLNAHSSFTASRHTAFGFTHGYEHPDNASELPPDSVLFEVEGGTPYGKLIQATEREVLLVKGQEFKVIRKDIIQYEPQRAKVLHIVLEAKNV